VLCCGAGHQTRKHVHAARLHQHLGSVAQSGGRSSTRRGPLAPLCGTVNRCLFWCCTDTGTRAHGLAATWPVQHVVADCRGPVSFHLKPITGQHDVPYSRWSPLSSLLHAPAWHGMHQALRPTAGMDGRARWCFFGRSLCIGLLDTALASFRLAADRTTRERALASVAQVGDSVRSDLPKHPAGMPHLSTCIPLYRVQQSLGRSVPFKFNLSSDTQAPLY
jgi:hypothetical protein